MPRAPPRRRYCATHQEMREAVARGLDGPGISPLDVLPQTWAHCPGFEEEMEHRRRKVEAIKVQTSAHGPLRLLPSMLDLITTSVAIHSLGPQAHTWESGSLTMGPNAGYHCYREGGAEKCTVGSWR